MSYIPAPARGVLTISAVEPKNNADTAWWDTNSGKLRRFSDVTTEWVPDGEPYPSQGYHGVFLGRGHMPPDIATTGGTAANSVAIGDAQVANSSAVAIGDGAQVGSQAPRSIVIGPSATAGATTAAYSGSAVVIGDGATAEGGGTSIVVGYGAHAETTGNIVVGYEAAAGDPAHYGASSLAIGYQATAQGSSCLAIGYQAGVIPNADGSGPANAMAVGYGATADGRGGGAAAVGYGATAGGMRSTAVGNTATCDTAAPDSIALGSYAKALHDSSAAIGNSAQTTAASQLMVGMTELHVKEKWTNASSLVLHSPSGAAWRITVSDAGVLSVAAA